MREEGIGIDEVDAEVGDVVGGLEVVGRAQSMVGEKMRDKVSEKADGKADERLDVETENSADEVVRKRRELNVSDLLGQDAIDEDVKPEEGVRGRYNWL